MKKIYEYVESFVVIGLVLAGIGGISYHVFREGGWIESIMGTIWNLESRHLLIAIPVVIAAVVMFNVRRKGRPVHGKTSRLPDLVLYGIMIAGTYFIGRFIATGRL
ncbi:MAG: hypothetical protein KIT18_06085 [Burkholderiales bacterium]|nr:hypothetical protein [Burkholderiales bacterium]